MRAIIHLFSAGFAATIMIIGATNASTVYSAGTQPMSKYGQIQNVQTYSSNPFWTPNSPYNQRMPQPVYANGPGLTTSDCQNTVSNLISAECGLRNNCVGVRISDIRPTIMTQLSRLPGHNYATACGGYIDAAFNEYVSVNAIANGSRTNALPTATVPNPNATPQESQFKIQNPYQMQLPTWNGEPWMQDMLDRKKELEQLQSQNGAGNEKLVRADFPTTYADLSFSERMQNEAAGFEPYKDARAYVPIKVEAQEDYLRRMQEMAQINQELARNSQPREQYCAKYPGDTQYCNPSQAQGDRQSAIEKIAQALKNAKK